MLPPRGSAHSNNKQESWNERYLQGRANWPGNPCRLIQETEPTLYRDPELPRALDLACGSGRNAIFLAHRGWSVTGVDFSDQALQRAREREKEEGVSVEWLLRDLEVWSPPERSFDLVLICYLHLPWPHFRAVLSKAERALRPGGNLLVTGHDRTNITEGNGKPKYEHVAYTPGEVAGALKRCVVIRAERDRYLPDHESSHGIPGAVQIDCVVHAFIPPAGALQ